MHVYPYEQWLHEYRVSTLTLLLGSLVRATTFLKPSTYDKLAQHRCLGEGFAWMEGLLVLATLIQTWRMRLVPGHPVVPVALVTLRPKGGIHV